MAFRVQSGQALFLGPSWGEGSASHSKRLSPAAAHTSRVAAFTPAVSAPAAAPFLGPPSLPAPTPHPTPAPHPLIPPHPNSAPPAGGVRGWKALSRRPLQTPTHRDSSQRPAPTPTPPCPAESRGRSWMRSPEIWVPAQPGILVQRGHFISGEPASCFLRMGALCSVTESTLCIGPLVSLVKKHIHVTVSLQNYAKSSFLLKVFPDCLHLTLSCCCECRCIVIYGCALKK